MILNYIIDREYTPSSVNKLFYNINYYFKNEIYVFKNARGVYFRFRESNYENLSYLDSSLSDKNKVKGELLGGIMGLRMIYQMMGEEEKIKKNCLNAIQKSNFHLMKRKDE